MFQSFSTSLMFSLDQSGQIVFASCTHWMGSYEKSSTYFQSWCHRHKMIKFPSLPVYVNFLRTFFDFEFKIWRLDSSMVACYVFWHEPVDSVSLEQETKLILICIFFQNIYLSPIPEIQILSLSVFVNWIIVHIWLGNVVPFVDPHSLRLIFLKQIQNISMIINQCSLKDSWKTLPPFFKPLVKKFLIIKSNLYVSIGSILSIPVQCQGC